MQTAGGETQGPKQPAHRIYAKYKFRLASPAPAQPDLPPRCCLKIGAALSSHWIYYLPKPGDEPGGKNKRKTKKNKMPTTSHSVLNTPAVPTPTNRYLPGCGSVGVVLLNTQHLSIKIAKWQIYSLVFIHCARG